MLIDEICDALSDIGYSSISIKFDESIHAKSVHGNMHTIHLNKGCVLSISEAYKLSIDLSEDAEAIRFCNNINIKYPMMRVYLISFNEFRDPPGVVISSLIILDELNSLFYKFIREYNASTKLIFEEFFSKYHYVAC